MKHHLSDPVPFTRTVRTLALLASLLALLTINHQLSTAQAQGTAFTYQGRLTAGGNVAQGIYDLRFAIYDAQSGGNAVGGPLTNSAVTVSNGLFTVALDFGVGIFAGESRWLAIGVRTNGGGSFSTLPGRQPLTPSPYAIHAAGALTATSAATATTASSVAPGGVNTAALADNAVTSDKIADGTIASADISTGGIDAGRIVGGDLQAARLKVGSGHALGGTLATIAGGSNNTANAVGDAVGGGWWNRAEGGYSVVGGGEANTANGYHAAVLGGWQNKATNDYATVAGGAWNYAGGPGAVVGGGGWDGLTLVGNVASGGASAVGGGSGNTASGLSATVGGGGYNTASGTRATVGGGFVNSATEYGATVAGGHVNQATNGYATVGGGYQNTAGSGGATVGGGEYNSADGLMATIGGGNQNKIQTNAYLSTIGGGYENEIRTNAYMSTIGGGDNNAVQVNADHASIGGGGYNTVNGAYASIPGGQQNVATSYGFAAGRRAKAVHTGSLVWADSTDADFASTGANQFLIRAGGGVGIGTDAPEAQLHVAGDAVVGGTNFTEVGHMARLVLGDGNHVIRSIYGGGVRIGTWPDPDAIALQDNTANVGIGTTNPATRLEVAGTVRASGFQGDGSALTSLSAGNLGSGTVPDARLSANVALLNSSPAFSGTVTAGGDLQGTRLKVGTGHTLSGALASIGGGFGNTASGYHAFVGGGSGNIASGYVAVVAGGDLNAATNAHSTVGGGNQNKAWGDAATVSGGNVNTASGAFATVAGGEQNVASGPGAFVGGGGYNGSTVGGNVASGPASTVGGGYANTIQPVAAYATIGGGYTNMIQTNASYATIAGGGFNVICTNATCATIGGGVVNTIQPWVGYGTIGGGYTNTIQANANFATIGGGGYNTIHPNADCATIPGGAFNSATSYAFAAGYRAKANHTGAFVWADSAEADFASTRNDEFNIRAAGGVRIQSNRGIALNDVNAPLITRGYDPFTSGAYTGLGRWGLFMEPFNLVIGIPSVGGRNFQVAKYELDGSRTPLATIDQAGNLTIAGTYYPISDRNAKENFKAVDSQDVLEKVVALPIARWNFKQEAGVLHLGPVAQDFHTAFGLGADNKHIATVDADGVALAAIQGLNQKVEEQRAALLAKDARIAALEQRLSTLENLIKSTTQKGN